MCFDLRPASRVRNRDAFSRPAEAEFLDRWLSQWSKRVCRIFIHRPALSPMDTSVSFVVNRWCSFRLLDSQRSCKRVCSAPSGGGGAARFVMVGVEGLADIRKLCSGMAPVSSAAGFKRGPALRATAGLTASFHFFDFFTSLCSFLGWPPLIGRQFDTTRLLIIIANLATPTYCQYEFDSFTLKIP